MAFRGLRACLRAGSALAVLTIATGAANAGGFAVREQSAYFQGMSFAGAAAGGDLSGMFWNPAVMTQFAGVNNVMSASWIIPHSDHTPTAGTYFGILPGTGNTADQALVPSSYFSYQINPNLWIGMSINSPFGLSVTFPDLWAGRDYAAAGTFLRTFNAAPSIAYRINDWISVGAGVQIQYAQASLTHGVTAVVRGGAVPVGDANLSGKGWGYGFTAGVTLMPTPATTIGIGYRSAINQKIDGGLSLPPALGGITDPANTTINLPDVVSLGIRQRLDPQWTLLGTVEWTNWSRIGTSVISGPPLPPALLNLPFEYQDGWLFSVGAEYRATDRLTLRTGFGYEISPITDQVRTPLLPDNDRVWASVGASWVMGPGIAADVAYTHIFVKDTPINISAASGNPWFATTGGITYIGNVNSYVDILSVSLKVRLDVFLNPQSWPK